MLRVVCVFAMPGKHKHVKWSARAVRKGQRATLRRSLKRQAARQKVVLPRLSKELAGVRRELELVRKRSNKHMVEAASWKSAAQQYKKELVASAAAAKQEGAAAKKEATRSQKCVERQTALVDTFKGYYEAASADAAHSRSRLLDAQEALKKERADNRTTRENLSTSARRWGWAQANCPPKWRRWLLNLAAKQPVRAEWDDE